MSKSAGLRRGASGFEKVEPIVDLICQVAALYASHLKMDRRGRKNG